MSKRGPRGLSRLQRRVIRATPGSNVEVAKLFGVSPAYVSMLRTGRRPIDFSTAEVFSATLVSLAFAGEA